MGPEPQQEFLLPGQARGVAPHDMSLEISALRNCRTNPASSVPDKRRSWLRGQLVVGTGRFPALAPHDAVEGFQVCPALALREILRRRHGGDFLCNGHDDELVDAGGSQKKAIASRNCPTSLLSNPDASRCSGKVQTASYSSIRAVVSTGNARPFRIATSKAAEAPLGLRMAATTTSVSMTNTHRFYVVSRGSWGRRSFSAHIGSPSGARLLTWAPMSAEDERTYARARQIRERADSRRTSTILSAT